MEGPTIVLQTRALSLGYGRKTVLSDVNLSVRAGEFWCFLGQNGAGKTTLLAGLLGLLQPQVGRLAFHPQSGWQERTGFVPQSCAINPSLPMTVGEFARLGLVGIRLTRAEQRQHLAWALDKMGLAGLAATDYWSLSGGQRQRALVARALVRRPALLLLDEPTNHLDLAMEEAFLHTLAGLHAEERNTVLVVTHKLTIAVRYATHIGLVAGGTLTAGRRDEMLSADKLEQLYGRAATAQVRAEVGSLA